MGVEFRTMNMRAGAALVEQLDTPQPAADERAEYLRDLVAEARKRTVLTNARLTLALRDGGGDPRELAVVAEDAALTAGQLAGYARMLAKEL